MEVQTQAAIQRLIRWCNQNSWSMNQTGLDGMSKILCRDFAEIGIELEAVELPPIKTFSHSNPWRTADGQAADGLNAPRFWKTQPTGPLLVGHHHRDAKRRVLWMIHYDTVYPPGSTPSTAVVVNEDRGADPKLVGPGVADAKGGIAVIALAIEAVIKFGLFPDLGITIVLNPDEEIGSPASSTWLRSLCQRQHHHRAMLFEPALPSGHLVAARKGSGNFAIHVKGRSAHAGRYIERGRNAIVHLASMIPEIMKLHRPQDGITINIGQTVGGGALNQVPDHATLQLNARVVKPDQCDELKRKMKSIVSAFTRDDYEAAVVGDFHCPPKPTTDEQRVLQHVFEQAGQSIGRLIKWQDTGGACDGSKLAAWGLPNIDTCGVTGGDLHSPTEWMLPASLPPAVKLLIAATGRAMKGS